MILPVSAASPMRLLVDEDTASATLITRLLAVGYEVVQLPHGTSDEVVFNEAQRLALPIEIRAGDCLL